MGVYTDNGNDDNIWHAPVLLNNNVALLIQIVVIHMEWCIKEGITADKISSTYTV
jgi:hypothetical protein